MGFWVRTQRQERRSHRGRERGGRRSGGGGGVDESARLSFVVQMLLATVTAQEARDWWAGLNCKVHFKAVAARL